MAVDNKASEKTRDCAQALAAAGVAVPNALLPAPGADWAKWAVIACDQYTSSPAYWQGVSEFVGPAASSLRLVLPELYLDSGFDGRARAIREAMREYVRLGTLRSAGEGFILTARTLGGGAVRHGLVVALDLEHYEYAKGAQSLIRATEATVADRLPPRVAIRRGSVLEIPHILVLYDDPGDTLLGPLIAEAEACEGGGAGAGAGAEATADAGAKAGAEATAADARADSERTADAGADAEAVADARARASAGAGADAGTKTDAGVTAAARASAGAGTAADAGAGAGRNQAAQAQALRDSVAREPSMKKPVLPGSERQGPTSARETGARPGGACGGGLKKLYDFELMMGGGHIRGYLANSEAHVGHIARTLGELAGRRAPSGESPCGAGGGQVNGVQCGGQDSSGQDAGGWQDSSGQSGSGQGAGRRQDTDSGQDSGGQGAGRRQDACSGQGTCGGQGSDGQDSGKQGAGGQGGGQGGGGQCAGGQDSSGQGGGQGSGRLLFAVGDGNHSLAAAKAHWEETKKALSGTVAPNGAESDGPVAGRCGLEAPAANSASADSLVAERAGLGDHAADEISSVDPVVAKVGSGKAKIAGSGFGAAGTDSGSHPVTGTDSSSHAATGTDSGGHVAEMDDLRGSGRDHPARYAMAELVNIHSEAIKFEPIHRALFNVAPDEALDALSSYFAHRGYSIRIEPQAAGEPDEPGALQAGCMQDVLRGGGKLDELDAPQAGCGQDAPHGKRGASVPQAAGEPDKQGDPQGAGGGFDLPMMWPGHRAVAHVASPASALPVAELQAFLDSFCESRPGAALDYIHGEDELSRLVEDEACFAFLLPPIDKAAFFDTIIRDGQFPRKAFSMGEARDKRYYLEARMIQPQL